MTGFALLGHASEIMEKSSVRLRLYLEMMPFLDGAKHYAKEWLFPAGSCKNETWYKANVMFDPNIPSYLQTLLYTPETSGGLLIAVSPGESESVMASFEEQKHWCWLIGEVLEGTGIEVL